MNLSNIVLRWRVSSRVYLAALAILFGVTGCGSAVHLVKERRAQRHFEEARELGAEQFAPYEYYSAKVRIAEAKRQAAYAEYGTAGRLSDEAAEFSLEAVQIAKKARRRQVIGDSEATE